VRKNYVLLAFVLQLKFSRVVDVSDYLAYVSNQLNYGFY